MDGPYWRYFVHLLFWRVSMPSNAFDNKTNRHSILEHGCRDCSLKRAFYNVEQQYKRPVETTTHGTYRNTDVHLLLQI